MNVVVAGGGSWGTAFSRLLADRGHEVTLACRDPAQAAAIAETGRNPRYLTTVDLQDVSAVHEAPAGADLYVLAVPSLAFAEVAAALPSGGPALSLTKGLAPASGERLSTLVRDRPVAVLSGPNMAEEIAQGLPSAAVIASEDEGLAAELQDAVNSTVFRVYINPDLTGVELCAAAKNVMGLAAGVSDGLGFGDNAKAAIITRGMAEMARMGEAFGAQPRTYAGMAGMGDLVATCTSRHSRNRRAGELLAKGVPAEWIESELGQVAEGLTTAPALRGLAESKNLELPITAAVCDVAFGGMTPQAALAELMAREPTEE